MANEMASVKQLEARRLGAEEWAKQAEHFFEAFSLLLGNTLTELLSVDRFISQ